MKITVPFDSVVEVTPLLLAGAEEMYCGVNGSRWKKTKIFPNARHMDYGNLDSFKELAKALQIAKSYNIPVFLCVNEYLSQGGFELLLEDIACALKLGVSGFILADTSLISSIRKIDPDCKIILSSFNPCFNSMALEFFQGLGVDRVVMPLSQLTLPEIFEISIDAQKRGIELEVFINNDTVCKNINGYCLYHKFSFENLFKPQYKSSYTYALTCLRWLSKLIPLSVKKKFGQMLWSSNKDFILRTSFPCREKYSIEILRQTNKGLLTKDILEDKSFEKNFARQYCILCSMFFFTQYGITAGKIGGRGSLLKKKLNDVKFARMYLDKIRDNAVSKDNYMQLGKTIYRQFYGQDCSNKQCYHLG